MLLAIDSPATGGVVLTHVHAWLFHVDFVNSGKFHFWHWRQSCPNAQITVNGFVDAFTNTTTACATAGNERQAGYPWR